MAAVSQVSPTLDSQTLDARKPQYWQFALDRPERNLSVARLVSQADPFIDELVAGWFPVFQRLAQEDLAVAFSGYTEAVLRGIPRLNRLLIETLYEHVQTVLANDKVRYEYERAFDEYSVTQRVLSPTEVHEGKDGTCLDLALLMASLVARVGLDPVYVQVSLQSGAHALTGVYIDTPPVDRRPQIPLSELRALVEAERLLIIDATGVLTSFPLWRHGLTFGDSCQAGWAWLVLAEEFAASNRSPSVDSLDTLLADARRIVGEGDTVLGSSEGAGVSPCSVSVDIRVAWRLGYHPFSAGAIERLERALRPADSGAELARHARAFVGRRALLKKLGDWLSTEEADSVFWLTGSPGSGKSAFCAHVARTRPEVSAIHVCSYGDDARTDARRVIGSLAYQLAQKEVAYRQYLLQLGLDDLHALSPVTLFRRFFIDPFTSGTRLVEMPSLLVVDGLDEASRGGANPLADLLGNELGRVQSTGSKLPRFLLTSREEPEVTRPLQALIPERIESDSREQLADLEEFVRNELASASEPAAAEYAHEIVHRSQGSFRYAECAIEEVRRGGSPEELPRGIGAWYWQHLGRVFGDSKNGDYTQRGKPLFELLAAAQGALPVVLVEAALALAPAQLDATLEPLSSLLVRRPDGIVPRHVTVLEWLTDRGSSGPYHVVAEEGHRRLAAVCWRQFQEAAWNLSPYAAAYLPIHLAEAGRWAEFLAFLQSPELGVINRWMDQGIPESASRALIRFSEVVDGIDIDHSELAPLATQLARLHSMRAEYEEAERWLSQALANTPIWRGRRTRAIALHELGSISLYRGDRESAAQLYRGALRLCRWGWPVLHDEAAANLVGLATAAAPNVRLRFARKALDEARRAGDIRHEVAASRLIGTALKSLGNEREASVVLRDALAKANENQLGRESVRIELLLAVMAYDAARDENSPPAEACNSFARALANAERVGDQYCIIEARTALAFCALARFASDEAEEWLKRAQSARHEAFHREFEAAHTLIAGAIAQQRGDMDGAKSSYARVFAIAEDLGPRVRQLFGSRALIGRGSVEWHLGQNEAALGHWERARQVAASVSDLLRSRSSRRIEYCRANSREPPV